MSEKNEIQKQLLISIGLSLKEAEIYELLLTQGEMTGGAIEKESRQKKIHILYLSLSSGDNWCPRYSARGRGGTLLRHLSS